MVAVDAGTGAAVDQPDGEGFVAVPRIADAAAIFYSARLDERQRLIAPETGLRS